MRKFKESLPSGTWKMLAMALVSLGLYGLIAFGIPRFDTHLLLPCFGALGLLYAGFLYLKPPEFDGFSLGLIFRLVLVFSLPSLSDDYFRFLFDGQLILEGINPYLYTPNEVKTQGLLEIPRWFHLMNSLDYHTVYPPVTQAMFALFALCGTLGLYPGVVLFKLVFLLIDSLNFFLIRKLLMKFNRPKQWALWYWLHPMVVLEFTGNLHFEILMLTGLLWVVRGIQKKSLVQVGLGLVVGIGVKLIPVLLIPFIWMKRSLWFTLISGVIGLLGFVLIFLPFSGEGVLENWISSLDLYFSKFEFNSSFHRIWPVVFGEGVSYLNPVLFLISMGFLGFWGHRKSMSIPVLFAGVLGFQLLFSQMVHPWYILPVMALGLFSRFPRTWVFAGMVLSASYITYSSLPYQQSTSVIWIEYLSIFAMAFAERRILKQSPS